MKMSSVSADNELYVNLSFPLVDYSSSVTSTLTRSIFKAHQEAFCTRCQINVKRSALLRHIVASHPAVTPMQVKYRSVLRQREFFCICSERFHISLTYEFLKHLWTHIGALDDHVEPEPVALKAVLDKFNKSDEHTALRSIPLVISTPPEVSRPSTPTTPSSPAVPDHRMTKLIALNALFDKYPFLEKISLSALHQLNISADLLDKLSTFNLTADNAITSQLSNLDTQQFQARLLKLTNNYMRAAPVVDACLLCTDQGLLCKASNYALITHYTKHLTSSHTGQPLARVCGGCRKRFLTDSDSRFAFYCYHVALCHSRRPTLRFYNYKTSLTTLCYQYYVPLPDFDSIANELHLDDEAFTLGLLDHYEDVASAYSGESLSSQLDRMDAHVALQQTHIYHLPHDLNTAKRLDDARAMVAAGDHLYCRRCDLDYRAMQDGAFDPSSLSYEINRPRYAGPRERIISVRSSSDDWNFFLSRDAFYARFSEIPAWISKDQTYELFRHDVGFKTFMLLLANKVPARKAENFRDEDHATKFVFLHCFFFKAICKPILDFCHVHPDIFVLPNSCLCRHPTVAVNQANPDPDDMRNTHRHCVIVFRTVEAYRAFKNFNTVNPDCIDALERSREISRNNALRARKFYRKEILSVSHYFKTIHYVSYPKIHEVDDKRNSDTQQALLDLADVDNEAEIFGEDGSAEDGGVSHSSANVHFDITAPVFFHFRPLFYILYENGLSDWLAEAQSRSKSAVLDLTERIRVRRDGNTDVSYNYIPVKEAIPFLCRYVVSHELGLRFDANAADTGRLDQLDFFRQLKAPFVDLPNVNYSDAVLFDQAANLDIRIPDKLHSKVRSLIDLAHIDIRRNQQKDKTIRELSELVRNLQSYVSLMAKRLCSSDNVGAPAMNEQPQSTTTTTDI